MCLLSCGDREQYHIEVENQEPVTIVRFDSLLTHFNQQEDTLVQRAIADSVGYFWYAYNSYLLRGEDAPLFREGVQNFLNDSLISILYADAQDAFADMSAESEALALLSARYQSLFPDKAAPIFQAHVSGLRMPISSIDSLVSISIDCYLGAGYHMYASRYFQYELPGHERSCIVADAGEVLLRNALKYPRGGSLLDMMIYEGRLLYLLSALVDDNSALTLLDYTPEQENWCIENEGKIWTTIIEQKDLFTFDNITIRKYTRQAPFTAPVSQDSPGRLGCWVGWRIMQSYAQKNNMTPYDIIGDTKSPTEILQLSGYNVR